MLLWNLRWVFRYFRCTLVWPNELNSLHFRSFQLIWHCNVYDWCVRACVRASEILENFAQRTFHNNIFSVFFFFFIKIVPGQNGISCFSYQHLEGHICTGTFNEHSTSVYFSLGFYVTQCPTVAYIVHSDQRFNAIDHRMWNYIQWIQ